ncbi:MAG: hypothetical protein B6D62_03070 [Candidatus Cloacimonas sp. 4484_275]|nr:MAG: hypothetical protein B6D62_03070 [Candidatus Cloacimonas sp. 4484_275]
MAKANWGNTAVIIPIYNGSAHLEKLLKRILKFFPKENIIAVDDASLDNSVEICVSFQIKVINFSVNKGKGAALTAGFREAIFQDFRYAFTIDCDLQHQPENFPDFIKLQNRRNSDLVIGKRNFAFAKMPFSRILSNSITSFVVSITTGYKILDSQSGFRLYSLDLIKKMSFRSERYQFETEIIFKFVRRKAKIDFVPIQTIYQTEKSYISHGRDIMNFVKIVIYELFFDRR